MHAELYKKLMKAFVAVLNVHIRTKTLKWDFHKATEPAYEALFDAAHAIAEKAEDMGCPVTTDTDVDLMAKTAYSALETALKDVQAAIAANKDPGLDNVLRGEYDKLQFQLGSLRGFCACEPEPKT